jgi:hypothetical protein
VRIDIPGVLMHLMRLIPGMLHCIKSFNIVHPYNIHDYFDAFSHMHRSLVLRFGSGDRRSSDRKELK